jgi:hypothetical protein
MNLIIVLELFADKTHTNFAIFDQIDVFHVRCLSKIEGKWTSSKKSFPAPVLAFARIKQNLSFFE